MKEIKNKPTKFAGVLFRSQLEARWAVCFNELRLYWEYEPRQFDLGAGLLYTPDFYLLNYDGFYGYAEVKPMVTVPELSKEKLFRLSEVIREPVLLLFGVPSKYTQAVFFINKIYGKDAYKEKYGFYDRFEQAIYYASRYRFKYDDI